MASKGRQLGAAHRLRKQHGVDAGLAHRGDHVVGQIAQRLGLVGPGSRPAAAARRGAHGTRPPSGSRKALRRVARKGSWSVSPRRAVGSSRNAAGREDLGRAEQTPVAGKTPPTRAKDCWCARRTARVGVEMSPSEPRERRYAIPMAGMLEMRRPKQQSPIMGGVGHAALPQSWAGRAVFCRFFSLDQRSGEAEILSL